ncbi:hypothetical protein RYJ27_00895 [Microbacterium limosum]|uniref:Uncharacterized protein n=1 Tax=Microbacterium limosum TaxID=3079935 RepID=A0AAU0MI47_9MICO|nr:hypothetical protein [Microbacterium sp. Y20]WOQ69836.1 hypothetical protein RYJ27_00895 [Microbacterium sp. Y20]
MGCPVSRRGVGEILVLAGCAVDIGVEAQQRRGGDDRSRQTLTTFSECIASASRIVRACRMRGMLAAAAR